MLSHLTDVRVWFFLVIALIWAKRSHAALQALHQSPEVDPHYRFPASRHPLVSVIIPAKNEEENIGDCIRGLLDQDYPDFEIIVANDNSKDKTEEILKSFGHRIRYVNVAATPQGWTGKNFAVHSALSLARGDWYLFTDADTRHSRSSVSAAVAHAQSRNLSFLTLLPKCLTGGFLESVIQPCMMGFTGLWFPMTKINSAASKDYFANGQYLLMTSDLHHRIGGHAAVFDQYLEDFALMKAAKDAGENVECALGMKIYGTRMYTTFSSMWRGWRRIFLHAFRRSAMTLLLKLGEVFVTAVLPFVVFLLLLASLIADPHSTIFTAALAGVVLGFIFLVVIKTYGIVKARRRFFIFFPVAALLLSGILADAMWMAGRRKKTKWR